MKRIACKERRLESAYDELRGVPHIAGHPNATLLHVCASNDISMAELNLASDSSSLIEANVQVASQKVPKTGATREPVVLVPLDMLLPTAEHVAVTKVDVQGAEYGVLRGLLRTITRDHPVIGYEADGKFVNQGNVHDILKPLGYVCTRTGGDQVCWHARPTGADVSEHDAGTHTPTRAHFGWFISAVRSISDGKHFG